MRVSPFAAVFVLAAPLTAVAQVPAGAEFQVNTYWTGYQWAPRVATAGNEIVVVWEGPERRVRLWHLGPAV